MENGRTMGGVVVAVTVALGGLAAGVAAQTPGPAGDAMFSAEVTVQRAVVDDQGRVTHELPGAKYLLERRADGRVRLTMRSTRTSPASGPLADPYAGIVVEQDSSGSLRVLDKDGVPMPGFPPPTGAVFDAPGRDDGIVTEARGAAARRGQFGQIFGRRQGTVRGLDRYVVKRGEAIEEVLVSPTLALPVEVNVVSAGTLTERHEFAYDQQADGRIVRRRTRSETRVGSAKDRLVSITTLADVRMSGGAR